MALYLMSIFIMMIYNFNHLHIIENNPVIVF